MRNEGAAPSKEWTVWARITGPQLPLADVRIGNMVVGPGPTGYRPVGPPSAPKLSHPPSSTYFAAIAPFMRVESDCWVIVRNVQAVSADLAIRRVTTEEIGPLVTALSAGEPKNPYRVQIWGADDGKNGSSFSAVVKTAGFDKDALDTARLDEARARLLSLRENTHLAVASDVFCRGIQYSDLVAGPPATASSILAFYQVLEACAEVVPWTRPTDYEDKCTAIAATLKAALESKTLTKKKVAAVRSANEALNRLDAKYASLRIEHAAVTFGLEKSWLERSRELGKFRNSKLGHANSLPNSTELNEWENSKGKGTAYALASTILAAAFQYVQEGSRS